jgi:hypothetical protein
MAHVAVNNIIPHRQNSVMMKFCDAAMMMLPVGAHCPGEILSDEAASSRHPAKIGRLNTSSGDFVCVTGLVTGRKCVTSW